MCDFSCWWCSEQCAQSVTGDGEGEMAEAADAAAPAGEPAAPEGGAPPAEGPAPMED